MAPVSAATERDEVKTIVVRDGVVSGAPAAPIAERPRRIGEDRAVLTLKNGVERRQKCARASEPPMGGGPGSQIKLRCYLILLSHHFEGDSAFLATSLAT